MKLTAQNFLEMLDDKGISYSVMSGHILLKGHDKQFIARIHERLNKNKNFEAGVVQYLNVQQNMSVKEYLFALESAGVNIELNGINELNFQGGKDKAKLRLASILENNSRLKAGVILHEAMKNPDLMDMIQERACIRWSEGYSDSLLMAVLSGISLTGETVKRDNNGQIVLRDKIDWERELATL